MKVRSRPLRRARPARHTPNAGGLQAEVDKEGWRQYAKKDRP
jgi:hypothetical protein